MLFANLAVQSFVADASAGSTDVDANSGRAAARTADSGDDFDFDGATAGDFGSFGSSAASRYLLDAAARIDRAVFACLAPEATNRIVNNELPLSSECLFASCRFGNVLELFILAGI